MSQKYSLKLAQPQMESSQFLSDYLSNSNDTGSNSLEFNADDREGAHCPDRHCAKCRGMSSSNLLLRASATIGSSALICEVASISFQRVRHGSELRRRQRRQQLRSQSRHRWDNENNHNQLDIDWANLDKKEFMKLVSSLNIADLFSEVTADSVRFSEGSKKWLMSEYVLQRKDRRIFVGGQGFVLFVRRRQHSSSLAMKVCLHSACRSRTERYQMKANLQIAAQRESRFISDLLVYYITAKFFVSVMYKAKHSSLKVIKREIGSFPPGFVKYYSACVLSAVYRLHRIGICHKDIKADNVLVDHRGLPQLADFGLAVECKADRDAYAPNKRVTSMQYYPPECLVLGAPTNDYKIDSWLFGFFVSEIYIPSSAHMWSKFQSSTDPTWRFHLCEGCQLESPRDESLEKLLRVLLRRDPRRRPSIRETMRAAYFGDISWTELEYEPPPEGLHVKTLFMEKGDE